jgi:hypothetical protein
LLFDTGGVALKVIEWLRRRLGTGKEEEAVMSDEEFERLFGNAGGDVQADPKKLPPTFEDVWAALLDTDEYLRTEAEKIRKTSRRIQRLVGDLERQLDATGRMIDDGFISLLERNFNVMGFFFQRSSERVSFGNEEYPSCYAKVDLFMENHNRALAVGVKTPPSIGKHREGAANPPGVIEANIEDIREQMERMEKLRRHFDLNNDRRELYGAVSAVFFPENVKYFALDQGFYVIEYADERMEVERPTGGGRVW